MLEAPIQNVDVDLAAKRVDGGVDLFIVASGHLNGSPETQRLILAKVQSYLEQLNTPEFQAVQPAKLPEDRHRSRLQTGARPCRSRTR
jgi:hypothetical protein